MIYTFSALSGATVTPSVVVSGNDKHSVMAIVTGSPSGGVCNLDGSLDGINWFDISGNQTITSSAMFHVVNKPVMYIRVNLSTLSGGPGPTVTFWYLGEPK